MGAGHEHHAGARHRWRLAVSFALVAAFFGVELRLRRLVAGSLALLSDAGHMAADVVTLGAALVATRIATREDTDRAAHLRLLPGRGVRLRARRAPHARRLGLHRRRGGRPHREPVEVRHRPMLVVGALGLVVNLIALLLLRGGAEESLNVKGAYLEVVADTAGRWASSSPACWSAATGEPVWDTVVALAIGVFVAVRAVTLGRQVLAVLGQHVPAGRGAPRA